MHKSPSWSRNFDLATELSDDAYHADAVGLPLGGDHDNSPGRASGLLPPPAAGASRLQRWLEIHGLNRPAPCQQLERLCLSHSAASAEGASPETLASLTLNESLLVIVDTLTPEELRRLAVAIDTIAQPERPASKSSPAAVQGGRNWQWTKVQASALWSGVAEKTSKLFADNTVGLNAPPPPQTQQARSSQSSRPPQPSMAGHSRTGGASHSIVSAPSEQGGEGSGGADPFVGGTSEERASALPRGTETRSAATGDALGAGPDSRPHIERQAHAEAQPRQNWGRQLVTNVSNAVSAFESLRNASPAGAGSTIATGASGSNDADGGGDNAGAKTAWTRRSKSPGSSTYHQDREFFDQISDLMD